MFFSENIEYIDMNDDHEFPLPLSNDNRTNPFLKKILYYFHTIYDEIPELFNLVFPYNLEDDDPTIFFDLFEILNSLLHLNDDCYLFKLFMEHFKLPRDVSHCNYEGKFIFCVRFRLSDFNRKKNIIIYEYDMFLGILDKSKKSYFHGMNWVSLKSNLHDPIKEEMFTTKVVMKSRELFKNWEDSIKKLCV